MRTSPSKIFVRISLKNPVNSITENIGQIMTRVCRAGDFNTGPNGEHLLSEAYKQKRRYVEQIMMDINGKFKKRIASILYEFEDWNANGRDGMYEFFIKRLKEVEGTFSTNITLQILPIITKSDD